MTWGIEAEERNVAQLYWVDGRLPTTERIDQLINSAASRFYDVHRDALPGIGPETKYVLVLRAELEDVHWREALALRTTPIKTGVRNIGVDANASHVHSNSDSRTLARYLRQQADSRIQTYVIHFVFRTPEERKDFDGETHIKSVFEKIGFDYTVQRTDDPNYMEQVRSLADDLIEPWGDPEGAMDSILYLSGFPTNDPIDYRGDP